MVNALNTMLNILIFQRFFVSLYTESRHWLSALVVCVAAPSVCAAQERVASPFNTVGYGYTKPKVPTVREKEMLEEVDDETDVENTTTPATDSLKAFMPLVALPLKRIHVNSPFGMRRDPMNRRNNRMHNGVDLRARYEEVYSMLPGIVTAVAYSTNGGNYVSINHGACVCSYLHLSKALVKQGDRVAAGQAIAISGNTGRRTTGPHLHLSCRWGNEKGRYFNPMLVLRFVVSKMKESLTPDPSPARPLVACKARIGRGVK